MPNEEHALAEFLNKNDLDLPPMPLTTIYQIHYRGVVYSSMAYTRVKKRNSYTLFDDGDKFATIKHFVFLHNKVIAVVQFPFQIPKHTLLLV